MAVDRWFFGIPILGNANNGSGGAAHSTNDTYIINYNIMCTDASAAMLTIFANVDNDLVNPAEVIIAAIKEIITGVVSQDVFFKIRPGTLFYMQCDPLGTAGTIKASYITVELPASGKERSRADVIAEIFNGKAEIKVGQFTYASGAKFFLEYSVNSKQIIQPVQQPSPGVADELNLVSTAATDTLAGIGAQKVTFDYVDASIVAHDNNVVEMSGTTPVNIVGTYADVYYIKRAWVSQVGSAGANLGDILFQDNA